MNFECTKYFMTSKGVNYNVGEKISSYDYNALTSTEQQKFQKLFDNDNDDNSIIDVAAAISLASMFDNSSSDGASSNDSSDSSFGGFDGGDGGGGGASGDW